MKNHKVRGDFGQKLILCIAIIFNSEMSFGSWSNRPDCLNPQNGISRLFNILCLRRFGRNEPDLTTADITTIARNGFLFAFDNVATFNNYQTTGQ